MPPVTAAFARYLAARSSLPSAFPLVFRPSYGAGIVLLGTIPVNTLQMSPLFFWSVLRPMQTGIVLLGTIPVKHALHVQGRLLCLCWCLCCFVLWSGCLAFGPGRREHAPNPRTCRIFFVASASGTASVCGSRKQHSDRGLGVFLLFPWHFSCRRFLHRRSAPRQYGARVGRRTCGCFLGAPQKNVS